MTDTASLRIAIAGEALIDLIREADGRFSPCLGGAVYNLSRALARQGVGTLYLNPFSSDMFGQALKQQMVNDGVVLSQPEPIQSVTSLAVVNLNSAGHPSYAFYREGVADRQVSTSQLNADCQLQPNSIELVCTGALALDPRDQAVYLPWLQSQKQAGKCVVVDANLRPSVMADLPAYRQCIHSFLQVADIIKMSDEDLDALEVIGDTPLEKAQQVFTNSGAKIFALTLGAAGAWVLTHTGGQYFAKEPAKLNIIDTVGAGDSFLAGLLAALTRLGGPNTSIANVLEKLNSDQATTILKHAIASASLCVQEQGCVPPTWEQTASWALAHPAM